MDAQSRDKAVRLMVHMAVCMANGGGGTVVFGIADRIEGREKAIIGVPAEIDTNLLRKAIYDQTDPKITPVFEELRVPEGTGRLILMLIYPGMPPYTDNSGWGSIRIGKDCQPLTGTLRRKIGVETGDTDYTGESVAAANSQLLSFTAIEALRNQLRKERAPDDLLRLTDIELLAALGLVRHHRFTRAALLLAGTELALREHCPGHNCTFLQMTSDTVYGIREDRVSALPLSVQRIQELLVPFNPITTYQQGLFHFEYHTWPEIAIREALMNAFCHVDLRIAGPVMVRLYPDRLDVSNNGGFIAGITPGNIFHHQPASRNPLLVEALTRLRLVNRSNLGINRMFSSLLIEGKEPPHIREIGESVLVSFPRRELHAAFRLFVAEEAEKGRDPGVDELL
nr:ATP-binding protein [Chlorobium limicola]